MYIELIAIINQIKIESARYVVHERTNKKVHRNTLTDGNLLLCSFIELLAPDAFIKERSSKSLEMKKESRRKEMAPQDGERLSISRYEKVNTHDTRSNV